LFFNIPLKHDIIKTSIRNKYGPERIITKVKKKSKRNDDLPVVGDSCVAEHRTTKLRLWRPNTGDLELNEKILVSAWLLRG
jgi:hypothetical protein